MKQTIDFFRNKRWNPEKERFFGVREKITWQSRSREVLCLNKRKKDGCPNNKKLNGDDPSTKLISSLEQHKSIHKTGQKPDGNTNSTFLYSDFLVTKKKVDHLSREAILLPLGLTILRLPVPLNYICSSHMQHKNSNALFPSLLTCSIRNRFLRHCILNENNPKCIISSFKKLFHMKMYYRFTVNCNLDLKWVLFILFLAPLLQTHNSEMPCLEIKNRIKACMCTPLEW